MRIIYATSELEEWIDLALKMQADHGWEPVYWITTPKNENAVRAKIPSVHCQDYIEATKGNYRELGIEKHIIPLDKAVISQYCEYERVALKMMDRMDPTAYSFNHAERLQFYYDLLLYWTNMMEALQADIVLFSESPHSLFAYVLYAVCEEKGIKILRFTPTHVDGLTFLSYSLKEMPNYLIDALKQPSEVSPHMKKYLAKNRSTYEDALPYYMKAYHEKSSISSFVKKYMSKIDRLIRHKITIAYKKSSTDSLRSSEISNLDMLQYKIQGIYVKHRLKSAYDTLATKPDLARPYIYVALHYQPEKTTSPEGDIFADQWLMIQMLARLAPSGWSVYVKEHDSQFAEKLYGEQGRNPEFYMSVSRLKNVSLIRRDISSFDLIDHAKAVATVTGTVGIEAVIRGIPLLSFGYPWYALCEGVFSTKTNSDLTQTFDKIESGYQVDSTRVETFLYAIESVSFSCYLNPGNKAGVAFDEETNIKNLLSCLEQYAEAN